MIGRLLGDISTIGNHPDSRGRRFISLIDLYPSLK